MRWLRNFWGWAQSLFRTTPRAWQTTRTEVVPDRPATGVVYLVGEGQHLWSVAFLCPCGCGELVQLNLLPDTRPQWDVRTHEDTTVSLTPSVWRTKGCRSHFFLRRGRVEWC